MSNIVINSSSLPLIDIVVFFTFSFKLIKALKTDHLERDFHTLLKCVSFSLQINAGYQNKNVLNHIFYLKKLI